MGPAESSAQSHRSARIACWAIVVAYFATAMVVQSIIRFDWGPDEPDHLQYIHVLSQGRLPTIDDTHQVQHGPIYYTLMAGVWRAMGVRQGPMDIPRDIHGLKQMSERGKLARRALRGATAVIGCAVLVVLMQIMAAIGTPWSWRPWLLMLAAGNPVMQYLGGVINNEMAAILYSSIICLFIVRRLRAGDCSVADAAVLGVLIGGTMLVKRTGLFVAPVALWLLWTVGEPSRRLQRLGAFAAGAVVVGPWWPLHTWRWTGGIAGTTIAPTDQPSLWFLISHPALVLPWVVGLLETALLPDWYWELILRLPVQIIGAVVLLLIAIVAVIGLIVRRDHFHVRLRAISVVAALLLLAGIVHYVVAVDWRAYMQGRYLLNALPWIICLLAGMRPITDAWNERFRESALWGRAREMLGPLMGLAVLVFDAAWWYLAWLFYMNIERRFL